MDWAQSWSRRLEYVLSDRPALDAFREWLAAHHNPYPLDLHFAIVAFEKMASERNDQAVELAQRIYEKYISSRTGTCSFFPTKTRNEVSARIRAMRHGQPSDAGLFAPLKSVLETHLRGLHEAFVHSEHFIDAFNQCSIGETDRRRRRSGATQLTAEALLLSRHEREHGESSVERMFSCSSRAPYVGRATTSHNDSAVSSSFSSDAPRRLRAIKEEQIRAQPHTFTVPRVEQWQSSDKTQYDHSTEEGRRQFADKLTKKILREMANRRKFDATEQQLRDIADRRLTAREAISGFADDAGGDEDDDLDRYVERMDEGDSVKASAQRSPGGALLSPTEWVRKERSPDRRDVSQGYLRAPSSHTNTFSSAFYQKDRTRQPIYDSSGIESNAPSGFSNSSRTSRGSAPRRSSKRLLTIGYKGADGVPVVAHVPTTTGTLTLREFRKHFSISSHANVQFFFKTECEDGSAPYQLLLIADDAQILPVFDGRVTAELKSRSPQ